VPKNETRRSRHAGAEAARAHKALRLPNASVHCSNAFTPLKLAIHGRARPQGRTMQEGTMCASRFHDSEGWGSSSVVSLKLFGFVGQ
jgi:hypothetical protein